jgi:hypothetical protein
MKHTEMIMVIEAHSQGKAVQVSAKLANLGWTDMRPATGFNFCEFDYRVKPELKESVNVLEFGAIKDDGMMKITLDLPEIEGFELAEGKQPRPVKFGEYSINMETLEATQWNGSCTSFDNAIVLKKKAPKYKKMRSKLFGSNFVEIKALKDAIAIIDSHYNWSADLRAATLELKKVLGDES